MFSQISSRRIVFDSIEEPSSVVDSPLGATSVLNGQTPSFVNDFVTYLSSFFEGVQETLGIGDAEQRLQFLKAKGEPHLRLL